MAAPYRLPRLRRLSVIKSRCLKSPDGLLCDMSIFCIRCTLTFCTLHIGLQCQPVVPNAASVCHSFKARTLLRHVAELQTACLLSAVLVLFHWLVLSQSHAALTWSHATPRGQTQWQHRADWTLSLTGSVSKSSCCSQKLCFFCHS